jgi:3-oxoacyl-[acyl-carrier protein] reductase
MRNISPEERANKTCIITGAGNGIGRAAAVALSARGTHTNIVMLDVEADDLTGTATMLSAGVNGKTIVYDLCGLRGIPELAEGIYREYGRIDCLMNIAGYTDPQPLLMTTLENMKKTYEVNVMAPFMLIRECVKYMKNTDEITKIINVASTAGITPRPGWLSYASSKAAVVSMSETLSAELADYKIKVYCVSPGRCATKLRRKLAPEEDQSKIMQPEDVAKILCDLADDGELVLDGQNIVIRK